MEISLRKASAFSEALLAAGKKQLLNRTVSVSIHSSKTIENVATDASEALRRAMDAAVRLSSAAYTLRALIGIANAQSGVAVLLTETKSLDAEEKILSSLSGSPAETYGEEIYTDVSEAQSALNMARERSKSPEGRYHSYDQVKVWVLNEALTETIENRLAEIRRRKIAISDAILEANTSTKVVVPQDIVGLLEEFKLV